MKNVFIDGVGNNPYFIDYYVVPFFTLLTLAFVIFKIADFFENKWKTKFSVRV